MTFRDPRDVAPDFRAEARAAPLSPFRFLGLCASFVRGALFAFLGATMRSPTIHHIFLTCKLYQTFVCAYTSRVGCRR